MQIELALPAGNWKTKKQKFDTFRFYFYSSFLPIIIDKSVKNVLLQKYESKKSFGKCQK